MTMSQVLSKATRTKATEASGNSIVVGKHPDDETMTMEAENEPPDNMMMMDAENRPTAMTKPTETAKNTSSTYMNSVAIKQSEPKKTPSLNKVEDTEKNATQEEKSKMTGSNNDTKTIPTNKQQTMQQ